MVYYIRIMEKDMETTIIGYILGLYWGYMGKMEKKMETTITIIRAVERPNNGCMGYLCTGISEV